jgi:uncharacterized membrane protein
MSDDPALAAFKKKLLVLPPLIVALVAFPMALGIVQRNGVYGYRTPASLASDKVWHDANLAAGITGVVLGLAGAILLYALLRRRPVSVALALLSAGVALVVLGMSMAAGALSS